MSGPLLFWNLLFNMKTHHNQPNIIVFVADDLGWNDVGWNNPDMKTPNLNTLAREGVIMDRAYVSPVCSPSRAALLTGIYPFRLGMQHGVIKRTRPHGLPLHVTTLPEKLRELGYATHMIGKWHLGFCNWSYTPTYRGFDSFFGFYSGSEDYYKHRAGKEKGYDFRFNKDVYKPPRKTYSTTMFKRHAEKVIKEHDKSQPLFMNVAFQSVHSPLQVPKKFEHIYSHIKNNDRRIFSGMVTAMDTAVGGIMKALMKKDMFDNTLIVFLSDNGGTPAYGGNNWPLRGGKSTQWEGGTRVPAFVWGSMLNRTHYVNKQMMHIVDWFPTLLSLAGGKTVNGIDGINQWETISKNLPTNRTEFVYTINQISGRAALRMGKYKLIEGSPGRYRDWYPPQLGKTQDFTLHESQNRVLDRHLNSTLLFDVESDPIESNNLYRRYPHIVHKMIAKLAEYKKGVIKPFKPRKTKHAHPKFWGGVWSPGWC